MPHVGIYGGKVWLLGSHAVSISTCFTATHEGRPSKATSIEVIEVTEHIDI